MKVVHLCLASFYPDNYSYQENMLPRFHKELGYDVEVIASTQSFDEYGRTCFLSNVGTYQNEYDIKVTRLAYKSDNFIWKKLKRYIGTYDAIEKAIPDILFIHGGQFLDMDQVVKYLKIHKDVTVYVDNHADFFNSALNWVSKYILHKMIWRYTEHSIEPYVKKFYGVLPARVDFLKETYGLPTEKCELLVMGADDELVEKARSNKSRDLIRKKYGIVQGDFLVMTGGKINQNRPETLNLMKAVHDSPIPSIKLIVFGVVSDELNDEFQILLKSEKIQFAGWLDLKNTYEYMAAADLIVFPGLHSVMWEQAVGIGIPCAFKRIKGFEHVDLGGNVVFIDDTSPRGLQRTIENIAANPDKYHKMKLKALEQGMKVFSYKNIAKRSIEIDT